MSSNKWNRIVNDDALKVPLLYGKCIWSNGNSCLLFFVFKNVPSFVKHKLMSIIMKCNVGLHKGRFEWMKEWVTHDEFSRFPTQHNIYELLSQCSSFNDDNWWHKTHIKNNIAIAMPIMYVVSWSCCYVWMTFFISRVFVGVVG